MALVLDLWDICLLISRSCRYSILECSPYLLNFTSLDGQWLECFFIEISVPVRLKQPQFQSIGSLI